MPFSVTKAQIHSSFHVTGNSRCVCSEGFRLENYCFHLGKMRHQKLLLVLFLSSVFATGFSSDSDIQKSEIEWKLMNHVMAPYHTESLEDIFKRKTGDASKNPDDVRFCLYTNSNNSDSFHELYYKDLNSVKKAPIIPNAPWKVLIHGFTQFQNSSMPGVVKNAYLEAMRTGIGAKVNTLVVDWGRLAYSTQDKLVPIYTAAVRNVEPAGNRTGQMIEFLLQNKAISNISTVHIIGFSLGSHVAGNAGNYLKAQALALGRISGLDPAGTLFYIPNFSGRQLTHGDAVSVDIYHTSWGSYGIGKNIGDADFHPNPGFNRPLQTQPYCLNMFNTNRLIQVCSHNLAPVFYAVSILNPDIYGCSDLSSMTNLRTCDKVGQFGELWNPKSTGDFYLNFPSRGLL